MNKLKKVKIIQLSLLLTGLVIIYFTYYHNNSNKKLDGISEQVRKEVIQKSPSTNEASNIFYNIKYTGIDLSGNRYILTSEEAVMKKGNNYSLDLKGVNYTFYFKDDTILKVTSKSGLYNSQNLDMKFKDEVLMSYNGNILQAEKAEYSNSGNYLKIQNNIKIESNFGNMSADEFFFDLNSKKLKINSYNDNNIKAKIKIDEKRF